MPEFGYTLSSEEHPPGDLVRYARRAEELGFPFAAISDHFHPWVDEQGQAPFVWAVLGGIAEATSTIRIGTGVTCPTIRVHPAIVAQAAATVATMMPGRFFLGVGTGENLNEHVTGEHWPAPDERLDMLEEAIEVIRTLWEGGYQTIRGDYYNVEQARIYTLPDEPPEIIVAADKPLASDLAGRSGDGLWSTQPDPETVKGFEEAGGEGPRYIQVHLCWAVSEDEAIETAHRVWPNAGIPGDLSQELVIPRHYEQAAQTVTLKLVAESVSCGPDPDGVLEHVQTCLEAGYDHVYFHQIGPDQEGFFRFWERELRPQLESL
ncbi:MAG: TIGR03557 family F420-dependent LLM class oxidoreductase [Actinobacteria bacterium]|nr:TIGR03557 family F420-dependent LLM class oxidoreductase [Actinomycetota bacterium]